MQVCWHPSSRASPPPPPLRRRRRSRRPRRPLASSPRRPRPSSPRPSLYRSPTKKMVLDYAELTQYGTTLKERRRLFSVCKRITRGNKGGCGMRGGGGTRRGRSATSGSTCHRTIILMMMTLGEFQIKTSS